MTMSAERRLRQIAATAAPAGPVIPAPVASLAELEGEAIGRFSAVRVVLLTVGKRGAPLGPVAEVEKGFKKHGIDIVSVDNVEALHPETEIIVTMGVPVGPDVLQRVPKLRLVAIAFSGTDHVDLSACKSRGVRVCHVPGYSTESTAELAVGMILSHLRRLPQCQRAIQEGSWDAPPQEDLRSKTVGIVGMGKIGLRLAELFHAFKVKSMVGYSLNQDPAFVALGGTFVDSLAALFLDADVICICVPLTDTSQGLVSDQLMQLLRPECLLVNVSRGGVVDEAALAKALVARRFRAALDVFGSEPLPADSPLRQAPQDALSMTPHVGYQSETSLAKRLDVTVKNILAFLAGQAINVVA